MILTCPSCATRYLVNPAKLRPGGRTVRCARCAHSWFEEAPPPDDTEAPDTASSGDETTAARSDEAPVRPRRAATSSNLPALPGTRPRGMELAGWAALALFLAVVIGGGWWFRSEIVAAWPPATRLYNALGVAVAEKPQKPQKPETQQRVPLEGALKFRNLAPTQQVVDGVPTLIIKGRIENVGPVAETIPPIQVVLLGNHQLGLATWTFKPPEPGIGAGESVAFETRFENPPSSAQDIRVTFATGSSPANSRQQ